MMPIAQLPDSVVNYLHKREIADDAIKQIEKAACDFFCFASVATEEIKKIIREQANDRRD